MDSIYSLLFGALMGENNRSEVIGRDTVGEYTIDTCYTVDQGWETAIWKGSNPMIIVGRWASKEAAQEGHSDWYEVCKLEPNSAWSVQTEQIEFFEEE